MANAEHLAILKQGVEVWNRWRQENPEIMPDLSKAAFSGANLSGVNLSDVILSGAVLHQSDLSEANLSRAVLYEADFIVANLIKANLSNADLSGANFLGANLSESDLNSANFNRANLNRANLSKAKLRNADLGWAQLRATLYKADLREADLRRADLSGANLEKADLRKAFLSDADLSDTNLNGANLRGANLTRALLVETKLDGTDLTGCQVYGISAWDLNLERTKQQDLVIEPLLMPAVTVDDIEMAQFIYLMLNNKKIRKIIDVIGRKGVLILGRFSKERKAVLDAIREELRRRDYLPMLFDFEKPGDRNLTETVTTLARMSRFVIADITDAKSIPHELQAIVPGMPSLPVQPIILESQFEYAMFKDLLDYDWVLLPYRYQDREGIITSLAENVIGPAENKAEEIAQRRQKMEALMARPE